MRIRLLMLIISLFPLTITAQRKKTDLTSLAVEYAQKSFSEFYEMLSIANDAHYADQVENNIAWCEKAFKKRGFTTTRINEEAFPLLLAERQVKNPVKTVLIYLQIDGQPVDFSLWQQESPYVPALKEQQKDGSWKTIEYKKLQEEFNPDWRIFARSTADAKGPAMAFLAALDAAAAVGIQPNYSIKVIMDFEEELGSPHLPEAVKKYKSELAADMLIIYDGPRHFSNQPTLSFGARGICEITLTVFGPRQPAHSGNYGNYTPNPAMRLAQLLASMKNEDGVVTLPGFYDGVVLSENEKEILREVPDDENTIRKFLGISAPDKIGDNFQESLQYPTLNIRGMNALFIGKESRTLIPATATAEIDIRLVPSSDANRLIGLVRDHVLAKGYHLVENEPTEEERLQYPRIASFKSNISYEAFQTPFTSECGIWLTKAMVNAFGKEPVKIRMMGGSIPISPFVITLGIPAVSVPTVNPDNNQHAPNENIRVGNYVEAIRTFVAILAEKL